MYTELLDRSTRIRPTQDRTIWQLEVDRHPYPSCPTALLLPAGTLGQLLQGGVEQGASGLLQWHREYSAWDMFVGEVDLLLRQVLHGAGM